ncbi:Biopolymer transport protein ExbD/TolR [Roseimaritima multifibrata]|uniref:Biopolymer transport protein ExbD/TolR n=1 Tax=Roseimaritima multifibrata TaxID=1930274 RepID=A0A517MM72_9BACT|nr:biopolymer transporter ExbD [Roseimaritima multifibrata]QDS95981.1 Biopolymer transport protein ExbD/TolR [Roseimaritima multifibrata]
MSDPSADLPDEPPPLPRKKREDGELDMTPMVDVTFLLLIFFMVTASFSLQKSIPMPRSQSDQPSTNQQDEEEDDFETVTVEIDEFNGYLIIAPTFERECASKLAITTGLKEAYNPSAGGMRLSITCHKKARLQSLVDVMDAGTISNYGELQITEVEELN